MRRFLATLAAAAGLGALASPAAAINLPAGFETETLVASAPSAVGAQFAPDGRLFYNAGGELRVRNPNGAIADLPGVPGFAYGLTLDRDFASNGYLYMSYVQDGPKHQRVDRLTISPANQQVTRTTILGKVNGPCDQDAPSNTVDCIPSKDPAVHALGTLISDPRDGTLWVGNGDNALPAPDDPHARNAQDVNSLSGKILHVDRDGNGLPGHPFCPADNDLTHNCTKVYARGMRNPYRFRLRPSDLVPIAGDVGLESREEVDVIRAGRNYGWPCYEGDIRTPGYHQNQPLCQSFYANPAAQGYQGPVYAYAHPGPPRSPRTIIGGPVYAPQGGPADFPAELHGDYFFADYLSGFIRRLRITPADALAEPPLPFATDQKGIVSLEQAPDGSLLVVEGFAEGPGRIYKIKYTAGSGGPGGGENTARDALFTLSVSRRGLRVDRRGRVSLKLRCRRASSPCRLKVALLTRARGGRRPRALARSKRVTVRPLRTSRVRLKLTRSARRALASRGRLSALLRVSGHGQRLQRRVVVRKRR